MFAYADFVGQVAREMAGELYGTMPGETNGEYHDALRPAKNGSAHAPTVPATLTPHTTSRETGSGGTQRGKSMASIQSIARYTGLSPATVSRYLNGHPYVSKEAQYAIELAIRELDYRPNASARSLRSGKTSRVAIVVFDASHPFCSGLIGGAGKAALQHGYDLLVQQAGAPGWQPERSVELAATRAVDGIIMASGSGLSRRHERELAALPVVTCDLDPSQSKLPGVYIDHYRSVLDGLEHLRERGARRIACVYVSGDQLASSSTRRQEAYRAFAGQYPSIEVIPVETENDLIEDGYTLLERLMQLPEPPDAVFTGSDDLAAGCLLAAQARGISVPEELRILGFDDGPVAEVLGISTIRQPVGRLGARAFQELYACISRGHTHESTDASTRSGRGTTGSARGSTAGSTLSSRGNAAAAGGGTAGSGSRIRVRYHLIARATT